jgi:hypothetical protein
MTSHTTVYRKLIEVARNGKTTTYEAVADMLGLNVDDPEDRNEIGRILSEISCQENAEGRPMLSAVVIIPEVGYPGKGFFLLARDMGAMSSSLDDRSFFAVELKRVHQYWMSEVVELHTAKLLQQ